MEGKLRVESFVRKQMHNELFTIKLGYLKDSNAAAHSVDTGIT